MNLFFIQTPLQLLNAIEAREKLSSKKNDLLIVEYSNEKRNNDQIDKILKYYKWDKIEKFPVYFTRKESFIRYIIFIYKIFIYKILKQKNTIEMVFLGEYRSDCMWMIVNNVSADKVYLLDDGMANLDIDLIFADLDKYNVGRAKKNDAVFSLLGLNNSNRSMVDLFTMFKFENLRHMKIIKNEFTYTKRNTEKLQINDDVIYFIGTGLTMPGYITEKYFFELFGKILNYYDGKTVVYIPHRREETKEFSLNFPNIRIIRFDNMIELEFLLKNTRPYHVASFYSTALVILEKIYKVKKIDAFLFDLKKMDEKNYRIAKKSYDYLHKYFNVINLENN